MMIIEKISLDETKPELTLTTYLLEDSQELLNGKNRPAVIICPGGAYLYCSDREAEAVALRFAAMGYHAFVLRYQVLSDGRGEGRARDFDFSQLSQISLEDREEDIFPAQMRNIAQAFTIIHQRAEEWLVDTDKLILCGFSAGGNSVTNYAVHWNKPVLTQDFDVAVLKPAAVIAGYPITDYLSHQAYVDQQEDWMKGLFKLSNLAFFGAEKPSDQQLLAASASRLIDEATPPMFIWATAGDQLVHVSQSTRLATALAEKGIPFELHIFEEGEHGLALGTQATASKSSHLNSDVSKWIDLAEAWLEKRFSLDI
ncbi:alpha/beta hydrolase [Streptococcus henryi]|uniref:alpha/beta hydrolase n=1 Tax=Streptococcus henryi TaxID=439219 RepID=UPI000370E161|nr:alpha/beta hydrolase [Streptococcus henryi]